MAGLFLIALVFFKRASLKGFASKSKVSELTSNNDDSLRFKIQSYDDIQSPMICINDKGLIIWLNKSATKTLSLGKGSSFFLDQEFQKDENNNYCYKNGGNKFRAMIKKVRSASTSGNLITLIPEDTSHYTYFKNVESDIRLDESIEKSLLSNNYLFASAGIPVSVNCEFKTNYTINPSEANIFNKTLKAVYAMAKDLDDSKINISLSDNDDELSVQFDIKNLFENDIDFAQELASQSGKGINLADAWNDVELSLSKRNARVFFFENDEIGGTSFQIQMASREKVFNQPASVIN
jgi:hypothetical protein